jgi:hypothetical protein
MSNHFQAALPLFMHHSTRTFFVEALKKSMELINKNRWAENGVFHGAVWRMLWALTKYVL